MTQAIGTNRLIDIWGKLAKLYKYRQRNITNYIAIDVQDVDCLRTVTLYGVGMSFGILNYLPTNPDDPDFPGPPWHSTKTFIDFDRFQIGWQEICDRVFRVKSLVQFTESTCPLPDGTPIPNILPDGAGIPTLPGRSPFD